MLLIVYLKLTSGMLVGKLIEKGGQNMFVSWLTQIGRLV